MGKATFVESTSGNGIDICPICLKVTGDVSLILTVPYPNQPGDNTIPYTSMPTALNVVFTPHSYCLCKAEGEQV
jgi:hypothetical protein